MLRMRNPSQDSRGGGGGRHAEGLSRKSRKGGFPRVMILLVLLEQLTARPPDIFDKTPDAFAFPSRGPVVVDFGIGVVGVRA